MPPGSTLGRAPSLQKPNRRADLMGMAAPLFPHRRNGHGAPVRRREPLRDGPRRVAGDALTAGDPPAGAAAPGAGAGQLPPRTSGRTALHLPGRHLLGPDILVQPDLFVVKTEEARTGDWSRMQTLLLAIEILSPSHQATGPLHQAAPVSGGGNSSGVVRGLRRAACGSLDARRDLPALRARTADLESGSHHREPFTLRCSGSFPPDLESMHTGFNMRAPLLALCVLVCVACSESTAAARDSRYGDGTGVGRRRGRDLQQLRHQPLPGSVLLGFPAGELSFRQLRRLDPPPRPGHGGGLHLGLERRRLPLRRDHGAGSLVLGTVPRRVAGRRLHPEFPDADQGGDPRSRCRRERGLHRRCARLPCRVWPGAGAASSFGIPPVATPQPLATSLRFKSISVGTTQACAIAMDDAAYCWAAATGRWASATATRVARSARHVSSPPRRWWWTARSSGRRSAPANGVTCGLTTDHRGYCWGDVQINGYPYPHPGVLGNGTFSGSKSPVPVSGGHAFQAISAGGAHACALALDGVAWCWGTNSLGVTGLGRSDGASATPAARGGKPPLLVSRGRVQPLVRHLGQSQSHCWGWEYGGALGYRQNSVDGQNVPRRVLPPPD